MSSSLYYVAEPPFWSIQGEGLRAGEPTIFVRLAGCNVTPEFWCYEWCDTKWARVRKGSPQVSAENIVRMVNRLPRTDWVDITGGEPLTQNITSLANLLSQNYMVQVETNGTIDPPKGLHVDHWTVSPKTSYTREIFWGIAKEFKWVISAKEDLERIRIHPSYRGVTILQPNNNDKEAIQICLKALEEHPTWRLGLQIHKIIGVK